jgi:glycosyltransferase involved in cell wall biosynthesis
VSDDEIKVTPVAKRPSLMIATPMYGGMCTGAYVQGLLFTMQKMRELGVNVAWCQMSNESLITRARNELTRVFLESDHDYLMFIDADIGFNGEAIAQLMAADRDVACGIYPKKEVNWSSVERAAKEGKPNLADYAGAFVLNMLGSNDAETDEQGFFEVRHGGTGFMLIKRGVFEALAPHVPTYRVSSFRDPETNEYIKPLTYEFFATSIDASGALLSEDYHFCELVRKHGGEIWASPFINLDHVGTYVFGGDILRSGGNLK